MTRFILTVRLLLTSAFTRHRSSSFAVGCLMSKSVLTAEVWTIFVRSHLRFLYFREFTVRVCLQEDRHRFSQSQPLALYQTSSCLTVLTAKQKSVIFTITTSQATQLAKQSQVEARAEEKSVMAHLQSVHSFLLFLLLRSSHMH